MDHCAGRFPERHGVVQGGDGQDAFIRPSIEYPTIRFECRWPQHPRGGDEHVEARASYRDPTPQYHPR